jgi:hypothetical protein
VIAADAPPPSPPAEIVVSRRDGSELIATSDTPMVLVKGQRREQALARRAVFITTSLTVVRPAEGDAPARYRWSYEGFVQRQMCFNSMTGLFSCTLAEAERVAEAERGEAPLAEADAFPLADAARARLAAALKARATALFEADRRAKLDTLLRASGVTVASATPAAKAPR